MSKSLELHKKYQGKWQTASKVPLKSREDLSLFYSPGVADPCEEIVKNKDLTNVYTNRGNTIAVVSDGSAVLGLGNIGPEAALPVMEGKCILFKEFGNVDAVPIVLNTQDPDEVINVIKLIAPSFGGINLEDISAPNCVKIERQLIKDLDIPVFHDDQHGTAVVICAALINAEKLTGKKLSNLNAFIVGMGAAGSSVARMIKKLGINTIYGCDINGMISSENKNNFVIEELLDEKIIKSASKNTKMIDGFKNADIFIGLSAPNIVSEKMIKLMNKDPWIFALANPMPEIMPDKAKRAGAKIVATGRSDFPNQVNNISAFPGIFRGVLSAKIEKITEDIKILSAKAIAECIDDNNLNYENILPSNLDKNISIKIAEKINNFTNKNV